MLTKEILAAYLPYDINISIQGLLNRMVTGINGDTLYTSGHPHIKWEKHPDLPQAVFLCLRPLSDLTKEITHNGETFVPILKLFPDIEILRYDDRKTNIGNNRCVDYSYKSAFGPTIGRLYYTQLDKMDYITVQKLLSWHFNIFKLTEDEYININTIYIK